MNSTNGGPADLLSGSLSPVAVTPVPATVPTCSCTLWDATDLSVRFCEEHHKYYRGPQELISVSSVLKTTWPIKPSWDGVDMSVVENARDRGVVVDRLFSLYVIGGLDRIPKGTRQDAVELFFKVRRWWDTHKHGETRSQVILADHELAGQCDVLDDDRVYDLKCTSEVEKVYPLQVAAYGELHFATFGRPAKSLTIIHVTKRYAEPRIIKVNMGEALQDWMVVRQMWSLVYRRAKAK